MKNKVTGSGGKSHSASKGSRDGFWLLVGGALLTVGALAGSWKNQQGPLRRPDEKWGIGVMIWGMILGLGAGFLFVAFVDSQVITWFGVASALTLTVLSLGTSNDFRTKIPVKDYAAKTRRFIAGASVAGLGFTLVASSPFAATPVVDPMACNLEYNSGDQAIRLQCIGAVSEAITVSGARLVSQEEIAVGQWRVTWASIDTKDGETNVRLKTSRGDERCTYSRNMSDLNGKTEKSCRT